MGNNKTKDRIDEHVHVHKDVILVPTNRAFEYPVF